ncbi:MAG: DUF5654 family protein [Candidatus Kariarchaeaceae archaeon]|jgi:hypothetical protein
MGIEKELKTLNIKTIVTTMILSALGFLVAFQWRDVIKETIEMMIPAGEGLAYKYGVAILVTTIAIIVTFVLIKVQNANIIPDKFERKVKKKFTRKKKR